MKKILACLFMLFVGTMARGQQPTSERIPSSALHTVLVGNCDTTAAVTVYREAIEEASKLDKIALIELAPEHFDDSVFDAMLAESTSRTCPVFFTITGARSIDARIVALIKAVDGAVVGDDIAFELNRNRGGEKNGTEAVAESRRRMIDAGLGAELATLLSGGADRAWIDRIGTIVRDPKNVPLDAILLASENEIRFQESSLELMGIKTHHDTRSMWKSIGRSSIRVNESERINVGAKQIAAELNARLGDVKNALERMEQVLDLPAPSKREVSPTKYRIAADNALQIAEATGRTLDEIEARLRGAPQVLRIAPEDEPVIDVAPESHAGAWKSRIKSRRTTLERLKSRAVEFESVRP